MGFLCFILAFFCAVSPVQAEDMDIGLYDPLPPPGSSFVRFFNAENTPQKIKIAGHGGYDPLSPMDLSPYYILPSGAENTLSLGDLEITLAAQDGGFYTIVNTQNHLTKIHDTLERNRAKAGLVFYNLSTQPNISLHANKGKITVFDSLAPLHAENRHVNAAQIDFSVHAPDGRVLQKTPTPIILERGQTYALIYTGDALRNFQAQTNTRKK